MNSSSSCQMDDNICRQLENQFKQIDPNASILPGIGLPSQGQGVCAITHTMPGMQPMQLNGAPCKSLLCNNALFTAECSNGRPLNLYEIMVPDIGSTNGNPSTSQAYMNNLARSGQMDVNASHFHWTGSAVPTTAIHHSSQTLPAPQFVSNTVASLAQFGNHP